MSKVTYSSESPYFSTTQTNWYLLPIALRNIGFDSTDQPLVIDAKYNNRPDSLSFDLYGTPAYWWVFVLRNMDALRDPIWDFTSGKLIFVPSAARIKQLLG